MTVFQLYTQYVPISTLKSNHATATELKPVDGLSQDTLAEIAAIRMHWSHQP